MVITRLEQLVGKLTENGIPHVVVPRDKGGAIVDVGPFGYAVNNSGKVSGGYVWKSVDCSKDWQEWSHLLGFTVSIDGAE